TEVGPDLDGRPAERLLVGQHDAGDRQPAGPGAAEQFLAGGERIGQIGTGWLAVRSGGGLVLVGHEAAADRVVGPLAKARAVVAVGGEAHAVRVVAELLP